MSNRMNVMNIGSFTIGGSVGVLATSGAHVSGVHQQYVNMAAQPPTQHHVGGHRAIDLVDDWNGSFNHVRPCTQDFFLQYNSAPNVYEMGRKPRGRALIINVNKVEGYSEPRNGTYRDCKALHDLFTQLHFDVQVEEDGEHGENLTAEGIKFYAEYSFKHPKFKSCKAAVMVLLSHGGKDDRGEFILGTDQERVYYTELFSLMNECPELQGKPKLVLVQACRGDGEEIFDEDEDEEDNVIIGSNEQWSDFLVGFASKPDMAALRNSRTGSYFIQAVVKVFAERAAESHLLDLMCQVDEILASNPRKKVDENTRKILRSIEPNTVTYQKKKLYFFPGMPQ